MIFNKSGMWWAYFDFWGTLRMISLQVTLLWPSMWIRRQIISTATDMESGGWENGWENPMGSFAVIPRLTKTWSVPARWVKMIIKLWNKTVVKVSSWQVDNNGWMDDTSICAEKVRTWGHDYQWSWLVMRLKSPQSVQWLWYKHLNTRSQSSDTDINI